MSNFAIIEIDSGLTVMLIPADATAEYVAAQHGGMVVDAGPFNCYEDAYDALLAIPSAVARRQASHE